MDIKRIILYSALMLVSYSLWTNWQADYVPAATVTAAPGPQDAGQHLLPGAPQSKPDGMLAVEKTGQTSAQAITVKTDTLSLKIDLSQGDIVAAELLNYPVSVEEKDRPFPLLQDTTSERYVANSSLFVVNDGEIENLDFHFTTTQTHYELPPNQDTLVVVLQGKNAEGLVVNKEYTFTKGSYLVKMRYLINNEGSEIWKGYMNTQLLRSSPTEDKSSMFHVGSYTGASYSIPGQQRYQKVKFKDMTKANLDVPATGGWVAMQQHYFLTSWIPDADIKHQFYTRALNDNYTIGAVTQPITVQPNASASVQSRLYLGPEVASVLKSIAPGLDMTIDYGWLWFLSSILFSLMRVIYSFVGNWGWAIVLVTMVIKLAFYRLSATSYKSMAAMRKLQPKLQELRERYGDDKAKISQATMELYRQEKVNPLGGCLPIVIQIPVFIALYWVLLESVELRQAPFILWINDLAAADPYHILPIIMGVTMLVQQKLNPAPPDPMQAKVMMFLPILFTALFWNFPAGLVLYWIVNNTLSILQQWYITRKYSDSKSTKAPVAIK